VRVQLSLPPERKIRDRIVKATEERESARKKALEIIEKVEGTAAVACT
jgi:hypothetical protein